MSTDANRRLHSEPFGYECNGELRDGSLATLIYPSGHTITYTPNAAGRLLSAVDLNGAPPTDDINYVTGTTYAPHGALAAMKNGMVSGGFAGITTTNRYNNRLQPLFLSAASTATILSLCYDFHLKVAVSDASCPWPASTGDNGDVFQIKNTRDNNRSQNFTYDSLNRIQQANSTGTNWGEIFTIDAWGNLTNRAGVSGKTSFEPLNVAPAMVNNRLTGFGYDAAGNMTSNGTATYTYDAENRITTTAGVTYTYDGDGERVKKSNGKLYWTGMGSDPLTETDLSGTPTADYIFFNGKRVARRDLPGGAVHYYFSDHLGSASVITNATGDIPPQEESDYYPYGGEMVIANGDTNNYKFTGKERDTESGLDNFGARYDASSLGRFMTPDWSAKPQGVPYAVLGDPQSLNLYAYVGNNPMARNDPSGHGPVEVNMNNCLHSEGANCGTPTNGSQPTPSRELTDAGAKPQNKASTTIPIPIVPVTPVLDKVVAAGKAVVGTVADVAGSTVTAFLIGVTYLVSPGAQVDQKELDFQKGIESRSTPFTGKPGDTTTLTNPDGTPRQVRRYGPDGHPETDVDYGHDHTGAGDPHAHDWGRPSNGGPPTHEDRNPPRPVQPGDPQPN